MNTYRIEEIILCLGIILTGLLYKFASLPLAAALPIMAVLFTVIPVVRYMDGKKRGLRGMALFLPVLCMGFVAGIVIVAWIVYMVQY